MHFILFIILIIVFVWTGFHFLRSNRPKTKFFSLAATSSIALCTLILFSYAHRRLDALVVILLLIATSAMFVFLTRKTT